MKIKSKKVLVACADCSYEVITGNKKRAISCPNCGEIIHVAEVKKVPINKLRLNQKTTQRGFGLAEFKDLYGVESSLQMSSLADQEAIWLGCDSPDPQYMTSTRKPGNGWTRLKAGEVWSDDVVCNTRMHLNRAQVARLLPHLINFVETGCIELEASND